MALAHAVAQTPPSPNAAPLPNGDQLLQRAIANQAKLAAEQERYECRVSDKITELDSKGKVKRTSTELKEQFYVNGAAVERTLAKDGKNLTPDQTKKEDERVMKETLKNSETKAKKKPDQESPDQRSKVQQMMVAMILANGHRESVDGRSVLLYDIAPNPNFHARSTNERLAQVMQGKISIDETTGEPIDIEMRTTQDFKIAGGVLATIPSPTASGSPTSWKAPEMRAPRYSCTPGSDLKKPLAIVTSIQRRRTRSARQSSSSEPCQMHQRAESPRMSHWPSSRLIHNRKGRKSSTASP